MVTSVQEVIFDLVFSNGWPIWAVAGSDFAAQGAFTIVATGSATVDAANSTLTVGYGTVPVSSLRQ
jgi:hypothetical protein